MEFAFLIPPLKRAGAPAAALRQIVIGAKQRCAKSATGFAGMHCDAKSWKTVLRFSCSQKCFTE